MAALTLLSILPMAAAIAVGGLREQQGSLDKDKDIGMSEAAPRDDSVNGQRAGDGSQAFAADYGGAHGTNDNHLDISTADRNNCVTQKTLARQALTDGTGCNTATAGFVSNADGSTNAPALCVEKYEAKYRGDHRAGDAWTVGVSFVGEVHLCEWRSVKANPASPIDDGVCEAGQVVTICPEEDVVETSAEGGAAALVEAGAGETKAVGTCGLDTHTCDDGSVLARDPEKTCRFGACAGSGAHSSFLQEGSEPTYQWTGVSISDDQNFCARMTPILGDYADKSVTDCGALAAGNTCTDRYEHILDGKAGDIKHCRDNSAGTACEAGAIHNCTWSFYMEDLISKHSSSEDNCAAKLLEAKRSLDGLLHSVQDVYNQLMQWNSIVQAENSTIRGLLEDQQNDWDDYVSEQATCDSIYTSSGSDLQAIQNEMTELRAIANPDVRSAVDVRQARGYQSSGTSSESCPADYPYVNTANTAYCCGSMGDAAGTNPAGLSTCTHRDCQDERGNSVPCVNNARSRNGDGQSDGEGMLSPSQTAAAAAAGSLVQKSSKYDMTDKAGDKHSSFVEMSETDMFLPTLSSFVEMDDTQVESACQSFSSLIERVQHKHGSKIKVRQPADCHAARAQLEIDFRNAFKALGQLYNQEIFTTESNRSICLNAATYNYKAGVEGIDGIDDQIQDAAGKIHEAQGEIARLEPMLHDVERAVNRMRSYVEGITTECGEESYIGHLYEDISKKIQELQECPGRNDFIIDVPHWRPKRVITDPDHGTPAPTPWYEDPKAADVRTIL